MGDKNPCEMADLCPAPEKSHLLLCLLLSHPCNLVLRSEVNHTPVLLVEDLKNPVLPMEFQHLDDRGLGPVTACWKILVSMLLLQMWSLDMPGLLSSLVVNLQTLGSWAEGGSGKGELLQAKVRTKEETSWHLQSRTASS